MVVAPRKTRNPSVRVTPGQGLQGDSSLALLTQDDSVSHSAAGTRADRSEEGCLRSLRGFFEASKLLHIAIRIVVLVQGFCLR